MKTIGIDLGTTNCCVSFINQDNQPNIINSAEGGRTTPSVFAINELDERLVGRAAIDQESINPEHTIRSVKRFMGTSKRLLIGGMERSPEEISSEILKKLKIDAENFFGEPVTNAVITVPAYFDSDQRQATKTAGELAGFNVLRIINEPTAAALAYGLDKKINETVLVFDLGGGTFDVTILKIDEDGVFEVLSTNGNTALGGDDFDLQIVNIIEDKIANDGIDIKTLGASEHTRIRNAAENAKKQLSVSQNASVTIPHLTFLDKTPYHFKHTISRDDFESKISKFIEQMKDCVSNALKDAKLDFSDINEVVFVGGSTRIPKIIESVQKWTGKKPNLSINPDEAVAIGAAVQAAILSGQSTRDILLLDVIPLSLGVETVGSVMSVMIKRNTTIPNEHTEMFTTHQDNLTSVDIRVFQGERPSVAHNKFLGEFSLIDIQPLPRGQAKIDVTFSVDANGILSVKAHDLITGQEKSIVITGNSSLSAEEIARMLSDAELNKESDDFERELSNLINVVRDQIVQTDELLRISNVLPDDVKDNIINLKSCLESGLEYRSIQILESLIQSATDDIKVASNFAYEKAQEYTNNVK
jgi:molecular chaperone DnaK